MFEDHNDTVYEIIKSAELLDLVDLEELNESHLHTGKSLADAVIDSGMVQRSTLLSAVAAYLGYTYQETQPSSIPPEVATAIKASTARMYAIVPVNADETSIDLLAKDPFNPSILSLIHI